MFSLAEFEKNVFLLLLVYLKSVYMPIHIYIYIYVYIYICIYIYIYQHSRGSEFLFSVWYQMPLHYANRLID